jgi:ParB family chromosome partitioning protein
MNNLLNIEERNELERCEVVIKQGLKTFVEVGQALMLIRDKRLYRAEFGTFEAYCQDKWQLTRQYVNNMVAASKVVSNIGMTTMVVKPQNERQARPLTKLEPELQAEAWQKTVEQHGENITQKKVEEVVKEFVPINNELKQAKKEPMFAEMTEQEILARAKEIEKSKKAHVSYNSGENEWYTPVNIIESARAVLGVIDLDPASNPVANEIVKAKKFYTKEDDGLSFSWFGNVWINPPYAQPLIQDFANKIISERDNCNQLIVLVNNATETKWFQCLMQKADAVCFPKGRVKFWNPDKVSATPLQGQSIIYFGHNISKFLQEFKGYGFVLKSTR